jgi:hypothetical protein
MSRTYSIVDRHRSEMFGRRRPILGTAILVGASRSAARHEMEKQKQRDAETQIAIERAADKKRREEEENDRRTQLAIDEAIARERSRNEDASKLPLCHEAVPVGHSTAHPIEQAQPYVSHGQGAGEKQEAKIWYCPGCGYGCKHGDKFCSKCGKKQLID